MWIQVHQYHIVQLDVGRGGEKLVNLDTSHVRQPDQCCLVITHNVPRGFVQALRSYRCSPHPVRMMRPVFLDERFSRDAVWISVQHQGPENRSSKKTGLIILTG